MIFDLLAVKLMGAVVQRISWKMKRANWFQSTGGKRKGERWTTSTACNFQTSTGGVVQRGGQLGRVTLLFFFYPEEKTQMNDKDATLREMWWERRRRRLGKTVREVTVSCLSRVN